MSLLSSCSVLFNLRVSSLNVSIAEGFGGLGTLQTGIAAGPLLGVDADIVYWDSGMTEREMSAQDILMTQAILGGERSPLLMNGGSLAAFYNDIDADVANHIQGEQTEGARQLCGSKRE